MSQDDQQEQPRQLSLAPVGYCALSIHILIITILSYYTVAAFRLCERHPGSCFLHPQYPLHILHNIHYGDTTRSTSRPVTPAHKEERDHNGLCGVFFAPHSTIPVASMHWISVFVQPSNFNDISSLAFTNMDKQNGRQSSTFHWCSKHPHDALV
jgi:hypothetical protein